MIDSNLISAFRYYRQLHAPSSPEASRALKWARDDIAKGVKRYTSKPGVVGAFARDAKRESAFLERVHLREVGFADKIVRIDHKGWFTAPNGDDGATLRGVVYQLPGKGRRARFLAGYLESESGGVVLDVSRVHLGEEGGVDSARDDSGAHDAALAADGEAERAAEKEREYQEAWRAGRDWANAAEKIQEARALRREYKRALKQLRVQEAQARLQLGKERKAAGGIPPLALKALRKQIDATRDICEEAHKKQEKAKEYVWREYYAAFNDGAGEEVFK